MTDLDIIEQIAQTLGQPLKKLETIDWNSNSYCLDRDNRVTALSLCDCDPAAITRALPLLPGLTELQTLYLIGNQISELTPLQALTGLQTLDLSSNQISELTPLQALTGLQTLYLSSNQISELPPLQALTRLQTLGLWRNQITTLPPWLTDFALPIVCNDEFNGKININHNPITTPPLEVVKQGNAAIKNYFAQLAVQGSDTIYEAKLMLVGEPGAGKTTLMHKLFDRDFKVPNPTQPSTLGIEVRQNWPFECAGKAEKIAAKAHIWDFGGQQIQYMLHQFFLTSDCVYVLMAEKRRELTNFDYWLNAINLLGQNSPVVIVFNEINLDAAASAIYDEKKYKTLFNRLDLHKLEVNFAAIDDGRFDTLTHTIGRKLANLDHMGKQVPARWVDIRRELEQRQNSKHIGITEYFAICNACDVTTEDDKMLILRYFHLLGIVLHFAEDPNLSDTLFLDPNWVVDAVYTVLADKTIVQANGVFDKTTIDGIWQQKGYSFEERAKLLQLMLKDNFELCYQLPPEPVPEQEQDRQPGQNQTRYRVPSLLSPRQPDYHWDNSNNLQFRFQYPFMPKGIVSRLIVRRHQTAMQDRLWQEGAVFSRSTGEGKSKDEHRVLAQVTEQLTPEGLKVIAIRLTGPASQRKELLTLLREEIKIIQSSSFPSLPFDEMVPCCCSECHTAQTPYFFKHEVLETFMHKGKTNIPCQSSAEDVDIAQLVGSVFDARELATREQKIENKHHPVNIHFAPVLTQHNSATSAVSETKTATPPESLTQPTQPRVAEANIPWWQVSLGGGLVAAAITLILMWFPDNLYLRFPLVVGGCITLLLLLKNPKRRFMRAFSSVLIAFGLFNLLPGLTVFSALAEHTFFASLKSMATAMNLGLIALLMLSLFLDYKMDKKA